MCPSIPETPTIATPTDGLIDRYLKGSSRRLIAYRGVMILLVVVSALTAVICYQGMSFHPVDNGLLTALTLVIGVVATLLKMIFYRQPEAHETQVGIEKPGGQA